jgi:transcriptional regulator GlxA family with amidase domain
MACLATVHSTSVKRARLSQSAHAVKNIGIVLFGGFALPETAAVAEIFQSANALAGTGTALNGQIPYKVCLLSAAGGRIDSSSSVFVWTESVEACRFAEGFWMLFIGGGDGARTAVRDGRLTAWLRRECPRSDLVVPMGDGRLLLEATGSGRAGSNQRWDESASESARYGLSHADVASPLHSALAAVQEDFGTEIARQIADHLVRPPQHTRLTATIRENVPVYVSEKIQASARWFEANCDRPIAIDEAAQVATMSERNFLRRFKIEMGVTPSEYLLYVRLDMCCRLLAETGLPVDKIARRCGLGGGGWLAKLFRKHLATTPTEYRASKRPTSTSS